MKFADLHIHSFYSDGTSNPQKIIELSKRENLSCIAFTDHDSVDAILNFPNLVYQGVEIIPAVEITTEEERCEIHILGYLIDYQNPLLLKKLDFLRNMRLERIKEMIKKLNNLNINISLEDVKSIATHSCLTRLHLARALLKRGLISSVLEGFQRYLGENSSCYVAGFYFKPSEAIRLIKD
ncbi:MAG: PHP domain-containing protein, partial [Candidatus Omnitrophica bacterium]|nr:PHP domain-containing protein [Candidatus Omnitrophota bacterium]